MLGQIFKELFNIHSSYNKQLEEDLIMYRGFLKNAQDVMAKNPIEWLESEKGKEVEERAVKLEEKIEELESLLNPKKHEK